MKPILLIIILLICSSCFIEKHIDRIEYPSNQVWYEYRELRVIEINQYNHHQRVTCVAGSPFPKYSYSFNWYYKPLYNVGDIVPLTDSLRLKIHYHNNWKKL